MQHFLFWLERLGARIGEFLPFILITYPTSPRQVSLNWARVIEAIIMAAVAGLASGYVAVRQIEVKLTAISETVTKDELLSAETRKKQIEIDELLHEHMGRAEKGINDLLERNKRKDMK